MGQALVTVAGFVTNGGAATTVVTPAPGDSITIPNFNVGSEAWLESFSATGGTVDFVRIRSPRMHDAAQGIRTWIGSPTTVPLIGWGGLENLYPGDTPIVEIDTTGAGSGVILLQYGFTDLTGSNPRFTTEADVLARGQHLMGCEVDLAGGAIGNWSPGVSLNANFDNFEAGNDYALVGYTCSVTTAGISIQGPDTSGWKVGGPGSNDPKVTRDYFVQLSANSGRPYIPIINANNKASTHLQNVDAAANTATKVTLFLVELS